MALPDYWRKIKVKPLRALTFLALACTAIYMAVTYYHVAEHSEISELRPADAIVVFGAAEYVGRPSPIYKARLDHARDLYRRGLAPFVITTGGHGEDEHFTEGGVGRDYLVANGIPESNVIAETQSADTSDSAERVSNIMRANHMKSCIAVSDGYHIYRIKLLMTKQGITTYGAPRPLTKPLSGVQRVVYFLREVLSVTLWRLNLT